MIDAARRGDLERLEALRSRGVDPDAKDESSSAQDTALLAAIDAAQAEAEGWLLAHGADPRRGSGWRTPMARAIEADDEDCLERLIERGVKVDAPLWSDRPTTPLQLAVIHRRENAARWLLDQGASPNETDGKGTPVLILAARDPKGEPMVRLLLERGANPLQRDSANRTAAMWASHADDALAVVDLLKAGAEPPQAPGEPLPPVSLPRRGLSSDGLNTAPGDPVQP
jgi:ankyrin repeat protein